MPGPAPLYHTMNMTMCVHGGKLTSIPAGPRVFVNGVDPVVCAADPTTIVGCLFTTPATGPHPCMTATWLVPAVRVMSMGRPVLLAGSVGMTQAADMAPQGAPLTSYNQPRVFGI